MKFNPFKGKNQNPEPSHQQNHHLGSKKLIDSVHLRDADESYQDLLEPWHERLCSLFRNLGRHDWAITQGDRLKRDKISSEEQKYRTEIWRFVAAIAALTCLDAPQAIIGSLGIPYEDFWIKIPAAVLSFIMVTALDISVGVLLSILEIKHRWQLLLKEAKEEAKGQSGYMEYYVKGLTSLLRDVKGFDGSPSRSKLLVCIIWIAAYIPLQGWGIYTAQALYGESQNISIPIVGIMMNLATSLYRAFQLEIPDQLGKLYDACYMAYKKTNPELLLDEVTWANILLDYAKNNAHKGINVNSFHADLTRKKVTRSLEVIRQDCRDETSTINKEETEALKAFAEKYQTAGTRKGKAVGWERPFEAEKQGIHTTFDSRRSSLKHDLLARLAELRLPLEEIGDSAQPIERMVMFVENTLGITRHETTTNMSPSFVPVVDTTTNSTIFSETHEVNGNGKHSTP
jgi:hypothetical protein